MDANDPIDDRSALRSAQADETGRYWPRYLDESLWPPAVLVTLSPEARALLAARRAVAADEARRNAPDPLIDKLASWLARVRDLAAWLALRNQPR